MSISCHIRDAHPSDAPFLAKCVLAGMHFTDFEDQLSDEASVIFRNLVVCEGREDTLYTYRWTRNGSR